jgi:lipoprotein-anchoring transpeptidase ErfK/SrfK
MLVRRIAPLSALLAVLVAVPTRAQDPQPAASQTIAPGVSAGGADLSGLTLEQAIAKLKAEVEPRLQKDLILGVAGKPWKLTMRDAKLVFDKTKTARIALEAKPGTADGAGGAAAKTDVPLQLKHSLPAVSAFLGKIAGDVAKAPRDATIKLGLRKQVVRRARLGKGLDVAVTAKLVNAALDDAAAPRVLHKRLSTVYPDVNANDLRSRFGTLITIDKSHFKLRLFKRLKFSKAYPIAVGQPAYPTPEGNFNIQDKQVDPVWSVPNSPWAGELAGTTVTGGSAANPLKARWMGIANGVGIHGTGQDYSIGTAASHGCIRMHVWHVKDLYRRVPVGTPVLIRHG